MQVTLPEIPDRDRYSSMECWLISRMLPEVYTSIAGGWKSLHCSAIGGTTSRYCGGK